MISEFQGEFRFLSNFWPCEIELEGIRFPSVEHAYQAAKTLDINTRIQMSLLDTPGQVKKIGKSIELRPDWEEIKIEVMRELLRQKFDITKHYDLWLELHMTKPEELVEGNWWEDTFWGVCKGKGENHLGKLLMEIRYETDVDRFPYEGQKGYKANENS